MLADEISRLESTISSLRIKHAELASEMDRFSNILSPIRSVPPEIITEIFLYFAPSMHRCSDSFYPVQVKLPWKLGLVCHRWRTISLSLGQLWAV
ncbi:hypothetical protein DFH08DRAFT_749699, partial [Mycena albidolilacea]